MSDNSKIEWTDASWNPVRGCDEISPGCDHCYARTFAERFRGVPGHAYERGFDIRTAPDQLGVPSRWRKPRRVFVNSMSDLFHARIPFSYVDCVVAQMWLANQHTYQTLTKRASRMAAYLNSANADAPNMWWGVSVEDRAHGLPRIEHLRNARAAVRFLSIEPLLEDLGTIDLTGIHWVIVGGESGFGARPCNVEWIRSIQRQCRDAGVPVFTKQLGAKPYVRCTNCGKDVGRHVTGGFVDACGPGHAVLIAEMLRIRSSKGGDWSEWPDDIRIREFPLPTEAQEVK